MPSYIPCSATLNKNTVRAVPAGFDILGSEAQQRQTGAAWTLADNRGPSAG